MSVGWVYVFSNKSLKGQVKIGYTTTHPQQRASELHTTGIPTPFLVEYEVKTDDCESLERSVHKQLKNKRVSKNREFFRVDVPTAIAVVKECAQGDYISEKISYRSPEEIQKARKEQEETRHGTQVAQELKSDINLRVSLAQTKLLGRISELNGNLRRTKSKIAIFPSAKNEKAVLIEDLEVRIGNNHAFLNRLLLKNYFWGKYISQAKIKHYFPKSLNEFEGLLNSNTSMGAIIVNDLFPTGVKLRVTYSRLSLMGGNSFASPYEFIGASMSYEFFVQGNKLYSGNFNDLEMKKFYGQTPLFDIKHCYRECFWAR